MSVEDFVEEFYQWMRPEYCRECGSGSDILSWRGEDAPHERYPNLMWPQWNPPTWAHFLCAAIALVPGLVQKARPESGEQLATRLGFAKHVQLREWWQCKDDEIVEDFFRKTRERVSSARIPLKKKREQ